MASQVFLFLLARNSRMLPPNPANPSNSSKRAKAAKLEAVAIQVGAKLAAVASQVFLFLLARNCRMLPPNASNPSNPSYPSKRAKPAIGAAKLSQVVPAGAAFLGAKLFAGAKLAAVASQVFLFLLARNCRMLPLNPASPSNSRKVPQGRLELPN